MSVNLEREVEWIEFVLLVGGEHGLRVLFATRKLLVLSLPKASLLYKFVNMSCACCVLMLLSEDRVLP